MWQIDSAVTHVLKVSPAKLIKADKLVDAYISLNWKVALKIIEHAQS